jgi:hypothetical protein
MGTSGGRKTGTQSTRPNYKWTPEDWALCARALDDGLGAAACRDLGWFPHLNTQQIRNGLNILNRKRKSICPCRAPLPEGESVCPACRQKRKDDRSAKVAAGKCVNCTSELTQPGSSATMCPRCIEKHRASMSNLLKKRKRGPSRTPQLFPWPAARSFRRLLPYLPAEHNLVDLFGGTGNFSAIAHEGGRNILAFNDVHPGVTTFIEAVVAEGAALNKTFRSEWGSTNPSSPSEFLMGVHKTRGRLTQPVRPLGPPPRRTRSLQGVQDALTGVPITNLDFSEAIRRFDGPKTLFVADPPWEGCESGFEFQLGSRHQELADQLLDAEGDFILMCASNRLSLQTWRKAPFHYWSLVGLAKELIVSSFEVKLPQLAPVDLAKFGFAA